LVGASVKHDETRTQKKQVSHARTGVVFTAQTWLQQLRQQQPQQQQPKLIECVLTLTVSVLSATAAICPLAST